MSQVRDHNLVFKALADPARVRILEFLRRPDADCCSFADKVCGCDIETALGLSQATISHHMKCLQQAGLVAGEKHGRWMHYRLDRDAFARAAEWLTGLSRDAEGARAKSPGHKARRRAA